MMIDVVVDLELTFALTIGARDEHHVDVRERMRRGEIVQRRLGIMHELRSRCKVRTRDGRRGLSNRQDSMTSFALCEQLGERSRSVEREEDLAWSHGSCHGLQRHRQSTKQLLGCGTRS